MQAQTATLPQLLSAFTVEKLRLYFAASQSLRPTIRPNLSGAKGVSCSSLSRADS